MSPHGPTPNETNCTDWQHDAIQRRATHHTCTLLTCATMALSEDSIVCWAALHTHTHTPNATALIHTLTSRAAVLCLQTNAVYRAVHTRITCAVWIHIPLYSQPYTHMRSIIYGMYVRVDSLAGVPHQFRSAVSCSLMSKSRQFYIVSCFVWIPTYFFVVFRTVSVQKNDVYEHLISRISRHLAMNRAYRKFSWISAVIRECHHWSTRKPKYYSLHNNDKCSETNSITLAYKNK